MNIASIYAIASSSITKKTKLFYANNQQHIDSFIEKKI